MTICIYFLRIGMALSEFEKLTNFCNCFCIFINDMSDIRNFHRLSRRFVDCLSIFFYFLITSHDEAVYLFTLTRFFQAVNIKYDNNNARKR